VRLLHSVKSGVRLPRILMARGVFMRNPLLGIRLFSLAMAVALIPATLKSQESVADAARKNRSKDQIVNKRVWTNDDIGSANSTEPDASKKETKESVSATLERFRMLDRYDLGVAVLRQAGAPDVVFPKRRDWEQKLFEAKQAWIDQVNRMEGHKDSSEASQQEELRLARGKQRIFEQVKAEGIEQARAETDPVLKAHLAYRRQLDSCTGATGKFRDLCDEALAQMKSKMQQEGIW
jgi:ABC-type phosphate transport system auxiliary subunit